MQNKKIFKFMLPYTFGIFLGLLIALFSAYMFEQTSDEKFCGSCHTMTPMIKSYLQSTHGGKNKNGTKAKCTDCHLPHDGLIHYMYEKGMTGMHDVFAQMFYDLDKINWEKKRKNREHFVYDSGCLKCHKDLQNATMPNYKAFIAHRAYFMNLVDKKCVSCHENVGHKNLGDYLKK